jgi:HPt (histidine-containing phosphotransfer) domain-containing protein
VLFRSCGNRRSAQRRQDNLRAEGGRRLGEISNEYKDIYGKLLRIEGFDVEAGLKYSGGKIKSYIAILQQFCDSFDESAKYIMDCKEKKDWENYAIKMHAYKGVFAIIGYPALFSWSRKLEYSAKVLSGNVDKIKLNDDSGKNLIPDDLVSAQTICEDESEAYLCSVRAFRDRLIKTALGNTQSEKKKKISKTALAVLLEELTEACRVYKTKDADNIVQKLKKCSVDKETDIKIAEIIRRIQNFDYEIVVEKIRLLCRLL